ncbi:hypothetical protein KL930_004862 [Ogataea haglerorum]|uniref:RRM domain-containing protein n=2 Tax=Ogataea TaxID=461281 RepID=A0ABQ7RBP6_9ASCO|nr:uncharacterized protein KL911_004592 [Ogataea haglerorum]KAG7693053.1 hypothetical protein KL951_004592 [Ogataea haglerorum]KAG7693703.1 hypothetical protein KL915_003993 [Ogataea haglerorum]KAG7703296.1 hypothetical protein KL914_004681 [Ogataea haglerorum]KAG7703856.1 hypothetical protein KL950_004653 [Ogataea haglerorum]KAG7714298.1 hypothetical protein KL913_004495 [Ogataea haglerorum]
MEQAGNQEESLLAPAGWPFSGLQLCTSYPPREKLKEIQHFNFVQNIMTNSDDEALFDDIYDDDKEEVKQEQQETAPKTGDAASEPANSAAQDGPSGAGEPGPAAAAAPAQAPAQASAQFPVMHAPPPMTIGGPGQRQFQDTVRADVQSKDQGKMFIGGLNWETTEESMKNYFSQFGDVIDLTIMKDNATGRSRGFGFLTFASSSSVDEVLKKTHVLDGKLIDPKRAIPKEEQDKTGKIFVGGVAPEVTEAEFTEYFQQFGNIIDSQLMLDKDTGRSRGYGFVTYDSPDAVDRVTQNKYVLFHGKNMEIKRAEPRNQQKAGSSYSNIGQPQQTYTQMAQMQQYWQQMQQMQQYWMQMQQVQQQGGDVSQAMQQMMQQYGQAMPGGNEQQNGGDDAKDAGDEVPNPQEQTTNLPSGPRGGVRHGGRPRGPKDSRDFRGRGDRGDRGERSGRSGGGGHKGRSRRGYHPYNR